MGFAIGIVCGLLLPSAWRLLERIRASRAASYLDVTSKERLEMLTRSGER